MRQELHYQLKLRKIPAIEITKVLEEHPPRQSIRLADDWQRGQAVAGKSFRFLEEVLRCGGFKPFTAEELNGRRKFGFLPSQNIGLQDQRRG